MYLRASAQQVAPDCGFDCDFNDLVALANNYVDLLIEFATYIFIFGIVYIGIRLAIYGGKSDERTKLKNIAIKAIVGYLLLLSAFFIIDLILSTLTTGNLGDTIST